MTSRVRPAFTAVAVTLAALLDIWLLAPRWPAGAWLLGALVAVFLPRSVANLGLGWSSLVSALKAWWWGYILCALALAVLVEWHPATVAVTLMSGAVYFVECVIQQLIYQHLVCAPLDDDLGPTARSDWISAVLFSIVHLPNPILVPATLLWGVAAARLFRQHGSLWAVAVLQYLLSGILFALAIHWSPNPFRIGPHYFAR